MKRPPWTMSKKKGYFLCCHLDRLTRAHFLMPRTDGGDAARPDCLWLGLAASWVAPQCCLLLGVASACCKVYPNFRRLLSRAAIPWHPTLTVALCVQPFLHFCPWLRPSFWETSFFRKITVQLILGENMKTFKVYLILWYVAALPLAILNKPPCLLDLFFHEWPSRQANPSSDGQTHTYPDGWL